MFKKISFLVFIFTTALIFSVNGQEAFELAKSAKNAQIKPFEYNGESDGFVIYSYEKKNGAYNYTYNIFNKDLKKLATKKYIYSKGNELYQFSTNKNTFCVVLANIEEDMIEVFTYDKKGRRAGKKRYTKDQIKKIDKVIEDENLKRIGEETDGLEIYFPKVVPSEDGYFLVTQNMKFKEGYQIEKTNDKLRKVWTKNILDEGKNLIHFAGVKSTGDKVSIVSFMKEKINKENIGARYDYYIGKQKEPEFTYDLMDDDANILMPMQILFDEEDNTILTGQYYEAGKMKESYMEGVFLMKLNSNGGQEFVNLTSWGDELKKTAKKKIRNIGEIYYTSNNILKQNNNYALLVELFKVNTKFEDVERESSGKKKKKRDESIQKPVYFHNSLNFLVLTIDGDDGELTDVYVVEKENSERRMPDLKASGNFGSMFQNPDYSAFKFNNSDSSSTKFVYFEEDDKEIKFKEVSLRGKAKPMIKSVPFEKSELFVAKNKPNVFKTGNEVTLVTFNERKNTFNYWKENVYNLTNAAQIKKMEMEKREAAIEKAKKEKLEAEKRAAEKLEKEGEEEDMPMEEKSDVKKKETEVKMEEKDAKPDSKKTEAEKRREALIQKLKDRAKERNTSQKKEE